MTSGLYRIIEHTADTGFEVEDSTKKQLFAKAARAFFAIMWKLGPGGSDEPATIEVTGNDPEELLVNFLEEFLYLYDAKNMVCTGIELVAVTEDVVRANARFRKYQDDTDHELLAVKAVTYHQIFIGRKNNMWTARIFLDI